MKKKKKILGAEELQNHVKRANNIKMSSTNRDDEIKRRQDKKKTRLLLVQHLTGSFQT